MQRVRILSMALVAMLAMSAAAVAIASAAAPEFNPATSGGSFKSTTATLTEEGEAFAIKCTSNTGTFTTTSAKEGTFAETFKGCKAASIETCTGEGESSGVIKAKGTFKLVFIKGEEVGLVGYPEPVTFACASNKITVTGCWAGPITPTKTKTKSFTVELKGKSKQEPDEVEGTSCTLKCSKDGGSAKECALEQKLEIIDENEIEIT
jgi:hypothetical protein